MTSEARADIRESFTTHYGQFQGVAFEIWPELTVFGAEQVMSRFAANLWRYRRPAGDGFMQWATAWITRETQRHRFIDRLFREEYELVYAAVERSLFQSAADDFAVEPRDHESALYMHLLANPRKIDRLMAPKKAKTSTMLYALTKSRMRGYRTFINDRHAKVSNHLNSGLGDCEWVTSPEEIGEVSESARIKMSESLAAA